MIEKEFLYLLFLTPMMLVVLGVCSIFLYYFAVFLGYKYEEGKQNNLSETERLIRRYRQDLKRYVFDSKKEAEYVLYRLKEKIGYIGWTSLASFYEETDQEFKKMDSRFGWFDLDRATVKKNHFFGKWAIIFPDPEPIWPNRNFHDYEEKNEESSS